MIDAIQRQNAVFRFRTTIPRFAVPSPFPGMDPYLEHPAIFAGFHDSFVTYLREALQLRLPDPYYAEVGDRVWFEYCVKRYLAIERNGSGLTVPN